MANLSGTPHHIAIVMDGNGRWASKRYLPRIAGHKQGLTTFKACIQSCLGHGVAVLTVFAFSSENWSRPADEVSGLMDLLSLAVAREIPRLQQDGVRLHFIGDRQGLSARVLQDLVHAEECTSSNVRMILNVCFNYGGRWDIAQAAAKLVRDGIPITEDSLGRAMSLAHVPDPDLIIRTGGEQRISNFLLWQSAYAELYFTDLFWPDFDKTALQDAILTYGRRQRRFGKTPEQVSSPIVTA